MEIQRVHTPKMAQLVVDRIRDDMRSGALSAGMRIGGESELMEQFAVSRPTLREALRVLEHAELVELRRGSNGGVAIRVPTLRPLQRSIDDLLLFGVNLSDAQLRGLLAPVRDRRGAA